MLITGWLWCLAGGVIAGLLAGMLGIGGGLVIVPLLIYLLPVLGVPPELVVQPCDLDFFRQLQPHGQHPAQQSLEQYDSS